MKTLITPNKYENGVKKNPMFVQMQNPFSNYEEREISLNCEKHGLVKATVYVNRLNGEEMGCVCPLCEKEQEEEEQKRVKERELQLEKERREEFYKSCNIKQEFWNKTFDDFKPITPKQKEYLAAIKKMLETRRGKLIVLGSNGAGKSMLANLALKDMGGLGYSMFQLSLKIRSLGKDDMSEYDFVETLIQAPLLVFDEIGRSKGSEFEINLMSYVLGERHSLDKPFILLSNTHFARDCPHGKEGCDKCFERYFDNDLLSRFRQDGKFIVFEKDVPDWRNPKNKGLFEK